MSTQKDPLEELIDPDRVFYATGVLLDAADFRAEQDYHRGRLARALAYLHGSGTVAGLRVEYQTEPVEDAPDAEEIVVHPGIAIDRFGRIIELPRPACIRLDRWYQGIAERENNGTSTDDKDTVADLIKAFHESPIHGVDAAAVTGVVADVFLRFVPCERGKTPAFATGPFDALNAVQPSRLRDAYELKLVLREEAEPQLPSNGWPDFNNLEPNTWVEAAQEAIFNSYPASDVDNDQNPERALEYTARQKRDGDRSSVFLARVVIPANSPVDQNTAPARTNDPVVVENQRRLFVYRARMLARLNSL